jgi:hypothetical protein
MLPALQAGLKTEEVAYYRGLAAVGHTANQDSGELETAYNLGVPDVERVYARALANNTTIMRQAGWE